MNATMGRPTTGVHRHLILLRALGISPDAGGMITIPDDLPRTYKEAVWSLCEEHGDYDWRYVGDMA